MHGAFWCQVLEPCQGSPSSVSLPATTLLDLVAPLSKVTRPGLFSHIVWVSVFMFEPLVQLSWYFLTGIQTTEAMPPFYWGMANRRGPALNLSVQCGPQSCCHTMQYANQWRREVAESPPALHRRVAKSATCGESHSACHEVGFQGLFLNVRPFF